MTNNLMYYIEPFPERLLFSQPAESTRVPFITVAIPHYKHRAYLEIALTSLFAQEGAAFEIVISDDGSPDDSNVVIPPLLEASGLRYRYYAQPQNLGYDGNVRFCIAAAQGRYVLLLGNDDALATPSTLRTLSAELERLGYPEVAFTNSKDWYSGEPLQRALLTTLLGSGPATALRFFRSFSFVSGLVFEREAALLHETDHWDKSIYYQIYLACRITASGGRMASIDQTVVRKDVRVNGVGVPNYVSKWGNTPWSLQPRHTGLDSVARVTFAAVRDLVPPLIVSRSIRLIFSQIYTTSYLNWLVEYRSVANWSFSAGVARSMWPSAVLKEYKQLERFDRLYLYILYTVVTIVGLFVPRVLLEKTKQVAAATVRRLLVSRTQRDARRRAHED